MEKPAKVVLLGEGMMMSCARFFGAPGDSHPLSFGFAGRVGKTSLLVRYINNTYSDRQESTIQASFLSKRLVINDERITLNVWDTAGQEKFHALGPIYYRDADGMRRDGPGVTWAEWEDLFATCVVVFFSRVTRGR